MTNNKAIKLIREHIAMLKDHPITYEDWGSYDIFEALETAIATLEDDAGRCTIENWNKEDDIYIWNIQQSTEWFEICQLSIDEWCLSYCTNHKFVGPKRSVLLTSNDPQECVEHAERWAKENLYD